MACKAATGLLLAVAVIVGGAWLCLDARPVKVWMAREVTTLLRPVFRGSIQIERIGAAGLWGASEVDARLLDPRGREVATVNGVSARIELLRLLESLIRGSGPDVAVFNVSIEHADMTLDAGEASPLRLLDSLEPARSNTSAGPSRSPGHVRVNLSDIRVRHAWVHRSPNTAPAFDADLDEVQASLWVENGRALVNVTKARLSTRQSPLDLDPQGDLRGSITLASGKAPELLARFDGSWGSKLPLAQAGQTTIDARGAFPDLHIVADATEGKAALHIEGGVALGEAVEVRGDFQSSKVNLRDFSPSLPESMLSASGTATLKLVNGGEGTFQVRADEGIFQGQRVPSATIEGTLASHHLTTTTAIQEPGLQATLQTEADLGSVLPRVLFRGIASSADLRQLRGLEPVSGRGQVDAQGSVDLARKRIEVSAGLGLQNFALEGISAARIDAQVSAAGSFDDPELRGGFHGWEASSSGITYGRIDGSFAGRPGDLSIAAALPGNEHAPDLAVSARLRLKAALGIEAAKLTLSNRGVALSITAAKIRVANGEVQVDDGRATGLGQPISFEGRYGRRTKVIRAHSESVELAEIKRLFDGTELFRDRDEFPTGQVAFGIDLDASTSRARGEAFVTGKNLSLDGKHRGTAEAHVTLKDSRVTAAVSAELRRGHLFASTDDLELAGPAVEPASWARAIGAVDVDANVDLRQVLRFLPQRHRPFAGLAGSLVVKGRVSRSRFDTAPDVHLKVRTDSLRISESDRALKDFDIDFAADVDGQTGRTEVEGTTSYRTATLFDFSVAATIPWQAVLQKTNEARSLFSNAPMEVTLALRKRKLSELPEPLKAIGIDAALDLKASGAGTLLAPRLDVQAALEGLVFDEEKDAAPMGVSLSGHYESGDGTVSLMMDGAGKPVLDLTSTFRAKVEDLFVTHSKLPDVEASTKLRLMEFPLESIPLLRDRRVLGLISGDADISVSSKEPPQGRAQLTASSLSVGGSRYTAGAFSGTLVQQAILAEARLEQNGGSATAKVKGRLVWSNNVPTLDRESGADLEVIAKHFGLSALQPFLSAAVRDVTGIVDGDLKASIGKSGRAAEASGALRLSEGAFKLPRLGEGFQNIEANIVVAPDGSIRADHITAQGMTGSMSASAEAHFTGLHFDGATANVVVPKGEALPLSIEGEKRADFWGNVSVSAKSARAGAGIDFRVEVPKAAILLPQVSTRPLQELTPDEHIRFRTQRGINVASSESEAGKPISEGQGDETLVTVDLHIRDTAVTRGADTQVQLDGELFVTPGKKTIVTGILRLGRGFLEVQGKRFEIENGTITFSGVPDNPVVVVTASWTAPDDTHVYADFVGPLKTGKVSLHSDPPHTNSEILSLILFGSTASGASPVAATGSATNGAVGLGGNLAAQGLNRALDQLTGLELTTRINTSESTNPRPELELRIAREISLSVAHVLGSPPPGTNPDLNLVTVDWRFRRNWSIEATVGDQGSSILDFVWRYQY